ncbi:armadillo repeat-containing protein 12-like [Eublepharis macularius]|uniref:Armadillo repeat-containing protein 12-like n=1 Tax=Eublepharis macularius TaxID=481883 RepID=A0AA97L162_EUBMA|nr:armadillo repeat-containing protein 12-like [Eublepharis macularius]
MKYYDLITTKNVVTAATGAGAIYLLSKTFLAALKSSSFKSEPRDLATQNAFLTMLYLGRVSQEHFKQQWEVGGFSVEYRPTPCARATIPGELRRTLQSLRQNLDGSSKKAALHTITQCVFLKESEASTCTYDDINLVASFLDDADNTIKAEALNALKAFTSVWKLKIKIQDYVPKITELVVSNWDGNLQVAGLTLVNGLQIADETLTQLRRLLPNFMDILLMADTLAKIQVLKLLRKMALKEDLLFDIMNCQVPPEFLSLFQPSLSGNLLYEMLVFVQQLNEGRLTPQYQSMQWQYHNLSLHNIVFGEKSRLSDCLLALIIHPEEEVQIQACKVILSLPFNKEGSKVISTLPFGTNISMHPNDSTRSSHPSETALGNLPFSSSTISSHATTNNVTVDDPSHSFHSLQGTEDTGHSLYPLESTGHDFHAADSSSVSSHPLDNATNSGPVLVDPMDSFHPIAAAYSDEDSDSSI